MTTKKMEASAEELQREYFNRLQDRYEAHYDDATSQLYRRRFIFSPMFDGIDFANTRVLEAMCGSGPTTGFLLSQGADVVGLDVSDSAITSFQNRWPGCQGIRASVFDSQLPAESFDGVVVQAGLHHLHPRVNDALDEIYRMLKPGGFFYFSEPHAGSLFDGMRNFWYRLDRSVFAENEASVDLAEMRERYADRFTFEVERYVGNVAYFLVLQSMVLRLPVAAKQYYAPPLLWLESWLGRLQGKLTAPLVVCRWRKKESVG